MLQKTDGKGQYVTFSDYYNYKDQSSVNPREGSILHTLHSFISSFSFSSDLLIISQPAKEYGSQRNKIR